MIGISTVGNPSRGRTARALVGGRNTLLAIAATLLFAHVASAADVVGTARLIRERRGHTATALGNGKILVAGGQNLSGAISDVEIFDAATGTFTAGTRLLAPRSEHSATRLADGRVVLIGGRGGEPLTSTEYYDPTRNVFSSGPSLNSSRFGHTATLLPDGRVIVIGGNAAGTAEIFDPSAGTFTALPCHLTEPRSFHAAARLGNGSILIAGGIASDGRTLASAEVLHPDTLECEPIATMFVARSRFVLRLLPDGKVQAIGGDADRTMELFNPKGYFSSLVHLAGTAESESAALRNPGRAAIIGPAARISSDETASGAGGRGTVRPVQSILDRTGYSMTELPENGVAIVAGGVSSSGRYQPTAVLFEASAATVTTDKTDYSPGETVVVTGTGWLPGETVTLNFHRDTNEPPDTVLSAVADADGNISNSEYVVQEFDLGVTFLLTATGQTSGYTAQTSFTDGSVKFTAAPAGVTLGVAAPGCVIGGKCMIETTYPGTNPNPNTTCTGTPNPSSRRAVTAGTLENNGVANKDGLRLEAPATSDQGGAFIEWTNPNGDAFSFPVVGNTRIICAPASSTNNRQYVANYECTAPAITMQPASQTVCPGSNATFSVAATGTGLTYQWRKNGVAISGATSSTLTLTSVTAANNGSYDVRVSGMCPTVTTITSNAATLTVSDTTAPVPSVSPLPDATGQCSATVSAPTATDNCAGTVTATTSDPLSYTTQGTFIVHWTYSDGNGNTTNQNQTVIVDDTTAPVPNLSSLADATGQCSAAIASAPTATDNCAGTLTGTTSDPLSRSTQGTSVVTWTFNDGNGNTATQNQSIVVDDTIAPVPNVSPLASATGECSATIGSAPTATDNCAGQITGTTPDPLTRSTQGTFSVTWTYDDGNGNSSTQNQSIVVDDVTAPVPDTASLANATGECSATIASAPTATDNCEGTIAGTTGDSLTRTTQGTFSVTWTFDDGNGNSSNQGQSIIVDDVTAPVPDAASLAAATGECSATISTTPTATDNCEGTIAGTTGDSLTRTTQGSSNVTWTFDDGNGNSSNQGQSIVVDDVTAPVPDAASLAAATGECSAAITTTPTATDNCVGAVVGTTTDSLSYSVQGTFGVTWTFDDGNGNSSNQGQSIVVDDVTPPTISAPPNLDFGTGSGATACGRTISDLGTPTAADNCAGFVVEVLGIPAGDFFPIGTTTVTYKITDVGGNVAMATQQVTVVDDTAPVVAAPLNVTVYTGAGATSCAVTVPDGTLGSATATDNCPGEVNLVRSGVPADNAFPVGTTTITYTATDLAGNTSTATQTVTVVDNTPPTITAPAAVNAVTGPDASVCGTVIPDSTLGSAIANDNCPGVTVGVSGIPAGNLFPVGTTTLTYTATDAAGNTATATQTVTVIDNTPPNLVLTTPASAAVGAGCTAPVPTVAFVASDNCPASLIPTQSPTPGSAVGPGNTTISMTVTDGSLNTTVKYTTFTVTNSPPVIGTITGPTTPLAIGSVTTISFNFTDPEPQPHTCTFDWDDPGSPSTVLNVAAGVTTCTASHTYASPGVFSIAVSVVDDCPGAATSPVSFGFDVIYDPNGGFVTGGGWINSPEGAYVEDPSLVGKANFGFVSKYQNGKTSTTPPVPTGQTEFQFKAGDLNFHSSEYEGGSLVVSGYKASYRGTGAINGSGNYKFLVVAYDGQRPGGGGVDRFRIKITTLSGDVVYDNRMGKSEDIDDADPMAIAEGSIVIHK